MLATIYPAGIRDHSIRRFKVTFSRRNILSVVGVLALAGATIGQVSAQKVNLTELMTPGPLGDKVLGSEKAPVTIVEYASMTCSHCANFHATVYPALKTKYIDTGKVRFIFREFPLDAIATGAFMLARCAPEDKYFSMVEVLFEQQKNWAFTKDPAKGLLAIAKQAGFTEQSFEACLTDNKLSEAVQEVARRANEKFGVNSTPTFFVNGQLVRGEMTTEALDKLLEPLLKG
jgi:protein-disulfide isomerase